MQKINYQREGGEREREAYREEKEIRKKCTRIFFFFFGGNERERCIICNYPGAKKKRLFETEHCVIVY